MANTIRAMGETKASVSSEGLMEEAYNNVRGIATALSELFQNVNITHRDLTGENNYSHDLKAFRFFDNDETSSETITSGNSLSVINNMTQTLRKLITEKTETVKYINIHAFGSESASMIYSSLNDDYKNDLQNGPANTPSTSRTSLTAKAVKE